MSRVFGGSRTLAAAAARAGTKASAAAPAAVSSPSSTAAKPKHSGILKPIPVSLAMRKFLGVPEISRSQAVKKIWEYIKGHQLQVDPHFLLFDLSYTRLLLEISIFEY